MIPGKEAYDLDKVRTNEGLAPFNRNYETPHPRKLVRETAKILERKFILGRHGVARKITERTLHVAAVGYLKKQVVRPPRENGAGKSHLALQLLPTHQNAHPFANCFPKRPVTSLRSGATP